MLAMMVSAGCNRTATPMVTGNPGANNVGSQTQQLPFNQSQEDKEDGISPSESLVPLPHRLPAGTALIIRLQSRV